MIQILVLHLLHDTVRQSNDEKKKGGEDTVGSNSFGRASQW